MRQLRTAVVARLTGSAFPFLKQLARDLTEIAPAETLRCTVGRGILVGEAQGAGGTVAALIGGGLFLVADRFSGGDSSATTVVVRGTELAIAGAGIGWLGDRLRRRGQEVARLARERQRIVADALDAEDRTRERISQRLHDEALQSLLAARQDIAQAIARPERHELVVRARERTHQAIRELRAAVLELHPVILELGLAPAIIAVAQQEAQRSGFQVEVDVAPGTDGDPERSRLVLSLARELLTNIARHAGAGYAGVSLRRCDGELHLEVWDDGCGIKLSRPEQALSDGHIGLASVAHRVEALGGAFELDSTPGSGTTVRAAIPAT